MNIKLLAVTSLLAAVFCHLAFFNMCIIVFPIEPARPQTKLFFLGSILKQNDVKQLIVFEDSLGPVNISAKSASMDNNFTNFLHEKAGHQQNPFEIKPIKKPLLEKTIDFHPKVTTKPTVDIMMEMHPADASERKSAEPSLEIQPYRPLRLHP